MRVDVRYWLRALLRREQLETDLDEELRYHLAREIERLRASGMPLDEAQRTARLGFGNVAVLKEESRDARGTRFIEELIADIGYALRLLRWSPGFAAVAILTLTMGIGLTTAIVSVVSAVLVRPLAYPESDRLVMVLPSQRTQGPPTFVTVTPGDFLEWRAQNASFASMAGFTGSTFVLTGAGEPQRLNGASVTSEFFATLGVAPLLGRTFTPDDSVEGRAQVVVLSGGLWRNRFAADPGIIGRRVTLDGAPYTVVGVMPETFGFPQEMPRPGIGPQVQVRLWTPAVLREGDRSNAFLLVMARLKPGRTMEQAHADLASLASRQWQQFGRRDRPAPDVRIVPLHSYVVAGVQPLLLVFLGAVLFVLLIACANVANLLAARAIARQKEVAVRMSLGSSRRRLVRQLLTESGVLGALGGIGGLMLAAPGTNALLALIPPGALPRAADVHIDLPVLLVTLLLAVGTGVAFGIAPALHATRIDTSSALRDGAVTQTAHTRLMRSLIVAEVALVLVLLTGAGLLMKSFLRLTAVDPGFKPQNILSLSVNLPDREYASIAQMNAFHANVLERFAHVAGVERVGAVNWLPLGGDLIRGDFLVEEVPENSRDLVASKPAVSPDYFSVMGMPIVRGRAFTSSDTDGTPGVAVITDGLARRLWPGRDAIGKRLKLGFGPPDADPWRTVIGVVGTVKQTGLGDESQEAVYTPLSQAPRPFLLAAMTYVVRTPLDPAAVAPVLRHEIQAVDANLPVDRITTLSDLLSDSVSEPRFRTVVVGAFAGVALALVAIGIMGVLAYLVTQRTREIGLRMALGADRVQVVGLVLRQTLTMSAVGVAIGLAAAAALTQLLRGYLFDVQPTDPMTFAGAAVLLVGVALLASYVPARRATDVDPLVALRSE
jgi:predicted permease